MTIEEFLKVFPDTPFALHYVERGTHKERSFGWHASFTTSYWTSDTDRPIYNHNPPTNMLGEYLEGWGDTSEGALEDLVTKVFNAAWNIRDARAKDLLQAEAALSDLKVALRR